MPPHDVENFVKFGGFHPSRATRLTNPDEIWCMSVVCGSVSVVSHAKFGPDWSRDGYRSPPVIAKLVKFEVFRPVG